MESLNKMGNDLYTSNTKEQKANVVIKKHKEMLEIMVINKTTCVYEDNTEALSNIDADILAEYLDDKRKNNSIKSSIYRSHTKAKGYLYANDWTGAYFGTITFRENRYSYEHAKAELRKLIRKLRYEDENVMYIFFLDLHEDGAIHFHFLIKSCNGKLPVVETRKKDKYGCVYEFTTEAYGGGISYMTKLNNVEKDKAFTYLTEKIRYDARIAFPNKKLFWASRNLEQPLKEKIYVTDIETFINEYVTSYELEYSNGYNNAVCNVNYYKFRIQ